MIKNNNETIVKQIYNEMTSAKQITIFAHENQDNDAYGSSVGLCYFLRALKIDARIADAEKITSRIVLPFIDSTLPKPDSHFIENSLGVILDTGNSNIVSSDKYKLCPKTVRIDHHIRNEKFADLEWIDSNYSSTSEMVGWFIMFNNKSLMSKIIANALYIGILADSGTFMYDTTQASTFELISIFYQHNFDKVALQNKMMLHDWNDILYDRNLSNEVKITKDQIAYLIIDDKLKAKYHIKDEEGKIFIMNNIKNFKVWFSVYYKPEKNVYKVSIRSREYDVRQVAVQYNGGGHRLAAGFSLPNLDAIPELLAKIKTIIND